MNLAMITVSGQCVGARDYGQASYYTKKLMKIAYLSVIGWNTLILATLPLSLKLYNLSEETIWLSTVLIVLHNGCAMLLWPAAFTLPNALRASNDVRFTMIVSIVSMLLFRILLIRMWRISVKCVRSRRVRRKKSNKGVITYHPDNLGQEKGAAAR